MQKDKVQTRANYDRLSPWYNFFAGGSEARLREIGLGILSVAPGETVLEIGCGPGVALRILAGQAGRAGRALGLDSSPGMCRVARRDFSRWPAAPTPWLLCADATHLPVRAGACDAIFMSFCLEILDEADIAATLIECRRVLRPAGRICIVAMALTTRPNLMTRLYAAAGRRFSTLVDCRPIAAADYLAAQGLPSASVSRRSLWGLPVDIVLARRPSG